MNFELNEDQQAIMEAVQRLLVKHAGAPRAIALNRQGQYDDELHAELSSSGFSTIATDLADEKGQGQLEAALIVEAIARAGGVVASAAQIMVAPALQQDALTGPIALCTEADLRQQLPIRFGAHAKQLLVLHEQDVSLILLQDNAMEPVRTSFGYPMGRVVSPSLIDNSQRGESLGADAVSVMTNWWRLSLAAEAVGTMSAALNNTVEYLKQRRQFGRAIGSFQAVQHRLAQCAIQVEASRWLTREAAHHGAQSETVAAAAAFALAAADQLFTETHQLSGAIGFTHEFDLHVWSMRLLALRQELDGVGGARRALVAARWGNTG